MKVISMLALLVLFGTQFCYSDYAPAPHRQIAMKRASFEGKKPEEIARFLAPPDKYTQKAVIAVLAETPEITMPLVERLLDDTSPWIRAGAVDVLAKMIENAENAKRPRLDSIPRKDMECLRRRGLYRVRINLHWE